MHLALRRPPAELLPPDPKHGTASAAQGGQAHVRHERRDVPPAHDPGRHELRDAVAPDVLDHRDGDEHGPGRRLVGVDGVSGRDGREGGDLYPRAGEADDDDDLIRGSVKRFTSVNTQKATTGQDFSTKKTHPPIPRVLEAEADNEVAQDHDEHERDHGDEPHLRLPDPLVPFRQGGADDVAGRAGGEEADQGAHQGREGGEADVLGIEAVWLRPKGLGLHEGDHQIAGAAEGDDETGE